MYTSMQACLHPIAASHEPHGHTVVGTAPCLQQAAPGHRVGMLQRVQHAGRAHLGCSLEVRNTCSRGTLDSRSACPTRSSRYHSVACQNRRNTLSLHQWPAGVPVRLLGVPSSSKLSGKRFRVTAS